MEDNGWVALSEANEWRREGGDGSASAAASWRGQRASERAQAISSADSGRSELEAARELLARRHGLRSDFVGVGQLSKILGIAPATIYGHIRTGRFFLPYRLFNVSPMVSLDDLARWYGSRAGVVPAFGAKPARKPAWMREDDDHEGREEGRGLTQAEVNAEIDKAAAAAMREMGLEPSKKRRKRGV